MDTKELIGRVLEIAVDKHGQDIRVLDVSENLSITDYFVLITSQNRRQSQAICAAIDTEMKHAGVPKARIEGYQAGWWVLLDFDEIVIHIFQGEARDFYDLERLWADAEDHSSSFLADLPRPAESPRDPDHEDSGTP